MAIKIDLPRKSKGKRPAFFSDPAIDHLLGMIMELTAEMTVLYARIDTLERMLDDARLVDRRKLADYRPDPAIEAERAEWRNLLMDRLLRTIKKAQEDD